MTILLPEQTETLRQLSDLWPDTPFVLIGANALALQMDLEWRQTNDLDGLRLAFDHHVRIAIDDSHSVNVATTPTIVVLKMVAFLDRPQREDDLGDIAQVLERYLGPIDDRRWELPIDFDNTSAFALGMDVGSLINSKEREVVTAFVAKARDEQDRHRTHALLIRNGPWLWREHPEVLFDRLAAFEKGMLEALSSRSLASPSG